MTGCVAAGYLVRILCVGINAEAEVLLKAPTLSEPRTATLNTYPLARARVAVGILNVVARLTQLVVRATRVLATQQSAAHTPSTLPCSPG